MSAELNPSLTEGILLKLGFKGPQFRRCQAFLIHVALEGVEFTGDCLPPELTDDQTSAGCAIASLRVMKLIETCGRCKSPAKSRNGAWVNVWRLVKGREETARVWLDRNGFRADQPKAEVVA